MEKKLKRVETWFNKSGMRVNDAKTCLSLFHNRDTAPIEIRLNDAIIRSEKTINVLGVLFDQKLQWSDQVAHTILKSNKALSAIRLIKFFFTTKELLQIITSNFYSVFYYNSEIWHLQSLKSNLKQKLLSTSAKAIKSCVKHCTNDISFIRIHEMYKRATPDNYLLYKHAQCVFKLINSQPPYTLEWAALNFNMIQTSRQINFKSMKQNKKRVGLNALANRSFILNDKIPLEWFNKSIILFKLKCKEKFLS